MTTLSGSITRKSAAHVLLNVVPPQRAGAIARSAGVVTANDRWCDVDWRTMESKAVKGVHVLGDATLSAPAMPKSGSMANNHAKIAAAGIIELLNGRTPSPLQIINTCYSFVDDKNVIHVASVHAYDTNDKTMLPGAAWVSSPLSPVRRPRPTAE